MLSAGDTNVGLVPADAADGTASGEVWYVLQVKRYGERRVVRHLAMHLVPAFLPLIESTRRRNRDRRDVRLEPLFPGYVFVQAPAPGFNPMYWHSVRWTPGVRRILGAEGVPAPVPLEVIDAIRAQMSELGFLRPGVRFALGARVRIRSGPLAGLEAIFQGPVSGSGRVRVLLELLGQVGRADLHELDLESA